MRWKAVLWESRSKNSVLEKIDLLEFFRIKLNKNPSNHSNCYGSRGNSQPYAFGSTISKLNAPIEFPIHEFY